MNITSTAFENGGQLPIDCTCDGVGINPPLAFSGIPGGAKSLALIVDDPDAPSGDFVHWVAWNIDPGTAHIAGGPLPVGASVGINGGGTKGYFAACPHSGTHRYFFKLFALDSMLGIDASSGKKELTDTMEGHIIEQATIVGTYARI